MSALYNQVMEDVYQSHSCRCSIFCVPFHPPRIRGGALRPDGPRAAGAVGSPYGFPPRAFRPPVPLRHRVVIPFVPTVIPQQTHHFFPDREFQMACANFCECLQRIREEAPIASTSLEFLQILSIFFVKGVKAFKSLKTPQTPQFAWNVWFFCILCFLCLFVFHVFLFFVFFYILFFLPCKVSKLRSLITSRVVTEFFMKGFFFFYGASLDQNALSLKVSLFSLVFFRWKNYRGFEF